MAFLLTPLQYPTGVLVRAFCLWALLTTWHAVAEAQEASISAKEAKPRGNLTHYRFVDQWTVSAEANGYVRRKEVKSTMWLTATDHGTDEKGRRSIDVLVTRVAVCVDVPAQKRKAEIYSDDEQTVEKLAAYELARPIAFLGQTVRLIFEPDGRLSQVEGTDRLCKRLDELYDRDFRGSEEDLLTREIERELLGELALCEAWTAAFVAHVPAALRTKGQAREACERRLTACVPSESWLRRIAAPLARSSTLQIEHDGHARLHQTMTLQDAKRIEAQIGPCKWSYEPVEATGETTVDLLPGGVVESMNSDLSVSLSSSLTLDGRDIPLKMTIAHAAEIAKIEHP